jgi:alpha-L-rhamnosidase
MRCEYRENPLGVDAYKPRFSWELISDQRQVVQMAYRVLPSTFMAVTTCCSVPAKQAITV